MATSPSKKKTPSTSPVRWKTSSVFAYPNAKIYEFSDAGLREVTYTETEHFNVTRDFLNRHEKMLELLLREEEEDLRGRER